MFGSVVFVCCGFVVWWLWWFRFVIFEYMFDLVSFVGVDLCDDEVSLIVWIVELEWVKLVVVVG